MNEIRLREPSYIDDPEINDYLNNLGGRLVEASPNPVGDFTFLPLATPWSMRLRCSVALSG